MTYVITIDIKKVDKRLLFFTHTMQINDIYANRTLIDKLTKWLQWFLLDISHIIYVKY